MPRKPTQKRAIVTVDAIVEAGFMAVASHGLAGATTRHIATLAGISVGSLYEYFANKEEVYEAMNRKLVEDIIGTIKPLIPSLTHMGIAEAIRTMLHAVGALLRRDNNRYLQCARHGIQSDIKADLTPINRVLIELMMQYLMHHPRYARLINLSAFSYIAINGGMFTLMKHLNEENPSISYDKLVDGLANMMAHYADGELALLEKP
ncbi:MAG: TetR/AcrR family transcriptional regulator [Aquabacterium sp.]|nr:TetR/AcrR family transcriptional regulator [Aquabacterium sp.]